MRAVVQILGMIVPLIVPLSAGAELGRVDEIYSPSMFWSGADMVVLEGVFDEELSLEDEWLVSDLLDLEFGGVCVILDVRHRVSGSEHWYLESVAITTDGRNMNDRAEELVLWAMEDDWCDAGF